MLAPVNYDKLTVRQSLSALCGGMAAKVELTLLIAGGERIWSDLALPGARFFKDRIVNRDVVL